MRTRRFMKVMSWLAAALSLGAWQAQAVPVLTPGTDYTKGNYAYSPAPVVNATNGTVTGGIRKFVDSLPGLTAAGTNNLGKYIPLAVADTNSYPGSDYYEIALVEYNEQMHSDLPGPLNTNTPGALGTVLRGYVQIEPPGALTIPAGSAHIALKYPNGTNMTFGGNQVYAFDKPHYLGPLILAVRQIPTRLKFYNLLPTGSAGEYFVPVDTTLNGAGPGPHQIGTDPVTGLPIYEMYTQNRATVHLHGGDNPWVSDGTAYQWITPAGEATSYTNGASHQNVPDMPVPPNGSATFYWPNGQSGRMMFYHDHAVGITRMVYAGIAGGYLLVDPVEEAAFAAAGVPGTITATPDLAHLIPVVIQDKTFVPDPVTLAATDPLWLDSTNTWNGRTPPPMGSLWFPHVYMPNQDPTSMTGANALGRWDYGPWFWPPWPVPAGSTPPVVSTSPEAFMDTPVVNGEAYPYVNVQPAKYRLQILSACNDRMVNLQMYVAEPITVGVVAGGSGYSSNATVTIAAPAAGGTAAGATVTVAGGVVTAITVTNAGAGYAVNEMPAVSILDATGSNALARASVLTDVAMVEACPDPAIPFPPLWLTQTPGMIHDVLDTRQGGVPNPVMRGPAFIQIGSEGGVLPGPVVHLNTPVGFEQNKRNIVVLNVSVKTLFMAPAERADVVIDFSKFAGKTVILYNDAPAPVPASDPRYDFYTGNPDTSPSAGANNQGGAPSTLPGYGPNTRTLVQFRVGAGADASAPPDDYDTNFVANLQNPVTGLPAIFKASQAAPVVPQLAYSAVGYTGGTITSPLGDNYARIQDMSMTYIPYGTNAAITNQMLPKCIQELFDLLGRMNATLGVELPFTSAFIQTTIPLGFSDPVTEVFNDGETQIWKITHNGVDTHGVHFHLFNVQVINRVGWDGSIRPPDPNELGWKDTVRMNPLEDILVAGRAKTPAVPFGSPESVRYLNPAIPPGSTFGFENVDPLTGNAPLVPVSNVLTNFGWEYTWHCHILGHEENDMMRPVQVNFATVVPAAPVLTGAGAAGPLANLAWTDGTPASAPSTMGNPANEIGFRVERATVMGSVTGVFAVVTSVPANTTNYVDATVAVGTVYGYRVVAFNVAGSATSNVARVITPALPLVITTAALSTGEVSLAYSQTLAATGGVLPYTWSVSAGALPGGLTLNAISGAITGTPTVAGAFTFTVRVQDFVAVSTTKALSITILTAPTITTTVLSTGEVTVAYSQTLAATGGVGAYTWSVSAGALPGGLTLNAVSGAITGTPTVAGTFTFTAQVRDANTVTATKVLSIRVLPVPTIVTTALPNGTVGVAYSQTLTASGGLLPYAWALTAGALPTGLALNPVTGAITGTPTVVGAFAFTMRLQDANAVTATQGLSITVLAATPNAPSALTASASPLSTNAPTVLVRWTDNSANETGFILQRSTSSNFTANVTNITLAANVITFTDTKVALNTRYYYRVLAFNASGNSAYSNTANATTAGQLPATPTALTVTVPATPTGRTQLNLRWTDNAFNESGFNVQRGTNAVGPWTTLTTMPANTATNPTVTGPVTGANGGLTPNTTYYYRVRAFNAAGNSPYTSTASGRTLP